MARRCAWGLVVLAACARSHAPPASENAPLGGDVVARVGDEGIPLSLVAEVARAQGAPPRRAVSALVDDAVAAQGARAKGYDKAPPVSWTIASARARLVVDRVRAAARGAGPATDEEIAELTRRHWQTFDLPEQSVVIHAAALYPKKRTAQSDAQVAALAAEVAKAVDGAPDAEEFEKRAKAVAHDPKLDLVVERLPPFVADGRTAFGDGAFEQAFAAAAFTLQTPGAQTRVETSYGWHVLQLIARLPGHVVPLEERRRALAEEALELRAHDAYGELLKRLRAANPVEISPAAESLMQSVAAASTP